MTNQCFRLGGFLVKWIEWLNDIIDNFTLEVEGYIGVAFTEGVAGIAAIIATVFDGRIGDLQGQGERILPRGRARHFHARIVGDDLVALEPRYLRTGIGLQQAFHDQFLAFLFDGWLLGEPRSFAFWNPISNRVFFFYNNRLKVWFYLVFFYSEV